MWIGYVLSHHTGAPLLHYQPTKSPEQLPVDGSLVGLSQNKASLVLVYQVAGIALIFDLTTVIDDLRAIAKGCESSSCWETGRTLPVAAVKKWLFTSYKKSRDTYLYTLLFH